MGGGDKGKWGVEVLTLRVCHLSHCQRIFFCIMLHVATSTDVYNFF